MFNLKAPSRTDRYDHWLTTALRTLLWLWVPQEAAILARSLPLKNRKSWSRDVFYVFASHTCLVHDVTDPDRWEQNVSNHSRAFATFKHKFLTQRARKRVKTNKNCSASTFDSTPMDRVCEASSLHSFSGWGSDHAFPRAMHLWCVGGNQQCICHNVLGVISNAFAMCWR